MAQGLGPAAGLARGWGYALQDMSQAGLEGQEHAALPNQILPRGDSVSLEAGKAFMDESLALHMVGGGGGADTGKAGPGLRPRRRAAADLAGSAGRGAWRRGAMSHKLP